MVDTIFPTPNTYTSRQGRQTQAPAFAGATSARPLGANTGVRPGTPANTVTATTSLVTVQPFAGVADVQTLASAGPHTFAFDAVYTVALAAQSASVPRSDIVYVQINDQQEDGTGAVNSSSATRVYLAGTTVTIPSLPNTRAFIIAVINVPIVGSSPTVTWVAPYAVAAGGVLPIQNNTSYPASPTPGQQVFRMDKGRTEQYFATGTGGKTTAGWYQVAGNPEIGVFTNAASYTATLADCLLTKNNGMATLELHTVRSSTFTSPLSQAVATIPANFFPALTTGLGDGTILSGISAIKAGVQVGGTGTLTVYTGAAGGTDLYVKFTYKTVDAPVVD